MASVDILLDNLDLHIVWCIHCRTDGDSTTTHNHHVTHIGIIFFTSYLANIRHIFSSGGEINNVVELELIVTTRNDGLVATFDGNNMIRNNSIETYSKGGPFTSNYASAFVNGAMGSVLISCLPMFAVAVVFAIVINVAQVRWQPTLKPLIPKFSKLNPINGFKRIISMDKLVELLKAVIKIGLIAYLAYSELTESVGLVNSLYDTDLFDAVAMIGKLVIDFGFRVAIIYLVIGLADYIYQKFKFNKDMRMTKQEIKDEFKQTEGDPKIKGQIRQRMREASQRRMMQQLPEADVVITNPTHLACAIKYDKSQAEAPILLAKGADYLAQKIKEEAKKNNIPIVENKPLARMLYHNVELNEEIPEELYQMTAEVLAYVYSLKEGAYVTT